MLFFLWKPETQEPLPVAERTKIPVPSVTSEEKPVLPVVVEEEVKEKKLEVGVQEVRQPEVAAEGEDQFQKGETTEAEQPQLAMVEEPKEPTITAEKPPIGRYTINVASFKTRMRAERLMSKLKDKGYDAFVAEAAVPQRGTWYRVSVGRFSSVGEAQAYAQTLKEKEGLDFFVRTIKATKE